MPQLGDFCHTLCFRSFSVSQLLPNFFFIINNNDIYYVYCNDTLSLVFPKDFRSSKYSLVHFLDSKVSKFVLSYLEKTCVPVSALSAWSCWYLIWKLWWILVVWQRRQDLASTFLMWVMVWYSRYWSCDEVNLMLIWPTSQSWHNMSRKKFEHLNFDYFLMVRGCSAWRLSSGKAFF